ncbi:alpha/beta hydrolase [Brackiella oedipodis]|uniref:alpha/beta hydrolase n=1 Tax=Brackiella oedipodis TaxID=124225 RepID=UPI00048CBEA3|nr:CocE/NonD family hydrolase [Brackiella oedipodis]
MNHQATPQFQGQAGLIDTAIDWPELEPQQSPKGWALVLHPHPLYDGTRNNKVVTTMARAFLNHGYVVLRPNFRGVGNSEGEFDKGEGETKDMLALVQQWLAAQPELATKPWCLAGFSFGTAVATQLFHEVQEQGIAPPQSLILTGAAVWRFQYRDCPLPPQTLLIHGEKDDVVPLQEVFEWLRDSKQAVTVITDAGHFFHGCLIELRQLVENAIQLASQA